MRKKTHEEKSSGSSLGGVVGNTITAVSQQVSFNQLHYWNPKTKEGKAAKAIAHGIVGEIAARVAGNAPGSAFTATMTNEALAEYSKEEADIAYPPREEHTESLDKNKAQGEPNSSSDEVYPDGTIKQRRYYDSQGRAEKDVDFTDHGNPKQHKVSHEHDWDWSKNPPRGK